MTLPDPMPQLSPSLQRALIKEADALRDELERVKGPGTAHGRMLAFWERMHEHIDVVEELNPGWSRVSSKGTFENAIADAFERLVEQRQAADALADAVELEQEGWAQDGVIGRGTNRALAAYRTARGQRGGEQ